MNTQSELLPERTIKDARVAYKLSPSRVVINRGKDQGVRLDQVFLIYALGDVVIDPVENSELGQLEIVRGRGRVTHLQANLATVDSIEEKRERVKTLTGFGAFATVLGPSETQTISEAPFDDVEVGDYCRPI